jgi:AraC family transcriptional regulator of adaptative response/methylated-DNA-[protein]-cysteine methyltransferase
MHTEGVMTERSATTASVNADATRWRAVVARDRRADGAFVYGVRSTKVYCRPSCASRQPRRDRVRFFDAPADAERSGYRACKRCRPDAVPRDPWLEKVGRACRYLARTDRQVPLAELARKLGGSAFHFQRNFKRLVGVTPREYAEACRLGRVKRGLRSAHGVTEAVVDAGYGSSSRFYERAVPKLGMSPTVYRHGGAGMKIRYTIMDSPLGRLLVASTERGVCAVEMGTTDVELERTLASEYPAGSIVRDESPDPAWTREILARASGRRPRVDLPLDVQATAFQWRVWQALGDIPYGETRSYADLAAAIGRPTAARAVARACAANPVAIAIPCHRAISSDGRLSGYRWGASRKQGLIARERTE